MFTRSGTLKFTDISLRPEELSEKILNTERNQAPACLMQYHQKKDGTIFNAALSANCFDCDGCSACCICVREMDPL